MTPIITYEDLYSLYHLNNLSTRYIGKLIGMSREYIRRVLRYYNIPIKHGGEAVKTQWINNDKRRLEQSEFGKNRLAKHGEEHPMWKGGIETNWAGYILEYCPVHPHAIGGKVRQHRLVMEKHLGRYLAKDEVVHHINGYRKDNRIENLQLMTAKEHNSLPKHPKHYKD